MPHGYLLTRQFHPRGDILAIPVDAERDLVANDMIGNTATVIELFTYFGVTVVVMVLVRQLSPYRPMSWLAGGKEE